MGMFAGMRDVGFSKCFLSSACKNDAAVEETCLCRCKNFCQMLQYLLARNSIDIIAGDFNYDLLRNCRKINFLIFSQITSRW